MLEQSGAKIRFYEFYCTRVFDLNSRAKRDEALVSVSKVWVVLLP